jgi:cytochrome c oxidase subunit 2
MSPPTALTLLGAELEISGYTGSQSALHPEGLSASVLNDLILIMVGVCTAVWLLVIGFLFLSLLWRERPVGDAGSERRIGGIVMIASTATVLVIAVLTAMSFLAEWRLPSASEEAPTIRVQGEQWWWRFTYEDPKSGSSFEAANELHLPVGRDVRLQLQSTDVIHSFWVPSLAGKKDLIPGRTNYLTIHADRPGVYRGQCAEFCGLQHGHMALLVVAENQADYERWFEAQKLDRRPPQDAVSAKGETVFQSKPCAACHTIRGTAASGKSGPDLTHFGSRAAIAADILPNTRGSAAAWIADPQTLKPGNNMPVVPLSSDELQQVSAYLTELK